MLRVLTLSLFAVTVLCGCLVDDEPYPRPGPGVPSHFLLGLPEIGVATYREKISIGFGEGFIAADTAGDEPSIPLVGYDATLVIGQDAAVVPLPELKRPTIDGDKRHWTSIPPGIHESLAVGFDFAQLRAVPVPSLIAVAEDGSLLPPIDRVFCYGRAPFAPCKAWDQAIIDGEIECVDSDYAILEPAKCLGYIPRTIWTVKTAGGAVLSSEDYFTSE